MASLDDLLDIERVADGNYIAVSGVKAAGAVETPHNLLLDPSNRRDHHAKLRSP